MIPSPALLALALACTDGGPAPPLPTLPTEAPSEIEALEAAGFAVGEGAFLFSDMSGCCDPDAQCWGNNPSTPYGTPAVPVPDGQPPVPDVAGSWGPVPDGLARTFQLRPDEAVVTLGTMPPDARYFSFRSYLGDRPATDNSIIGSLGASLNHLVMASERGGEAAWGQPVAILTTLDEAVDREVRAALVEAGWDPRHIHADRITGEVVAPGLAAGSDTFFAVVRAGVFDDVEAGRAYLAEPPLRVLRVTPRAEQPWSEPWAWPELPARGSGEVEDPALAEALGQLVDAVLAAHPEREALAVEAIPYWLETLACVAEERNCTGDIRDRYSAITPGFELGNDEAVIAVGVNHERTGKASYSSASIQTIEAQRGIESFESPWMPGSARAWLPDHPLADDLYAWVVARDCGGWPAPCAEVPLGCPGVPLDEKLKITIRAYLEPSTGAAPLPEELVPDVVIKLGAAP
jgi:hypothetical protein